MLVKSTLVSINHHRRPKRLAKGRAVATIATSEGPADGWIEKLRKRLDPFKVIETEELVRGRSRDTCWRHPLLRKEFDKLFPVAQVLIEPENAHDLRNCIEAISELGVPMTLRGAGTGSFSGACTTRGGVIIDMSKYMLEDVEVDAQRGIARCSPGASLFSVRQAALAVGWDMRIYPTAIPQEGTIGGFIGTSIWGAGSLVYGSLQSPGNFHGIDVMSVTKHSELLSFKDDLQGVDPLNCFLGTQGTIGVISNLEIALSPSISTTSFVFSFPELRYTTNYLVK
eukprot:TRINITY_DN2086_c0_g1_i2.p1 TRINITY_DN2086_c0_g1~~TRINITY_DN2086_c0_g1_i2.p1  ORF type:complete len:283 (-),score=34.34 TRINITY_DN2086_c0_g1_i2:1183-2031(-)